MIEEWRPVPGHEGAYEVSSLGQVRSLDRWITFPSRSGTASGRAVKGRVLDGWRNADGYRMVGIAGRQCYVHALVAEAFFGPRPPGMEVCHADGSRDNNHISNLRYDTRAGNAADAIRHGTMRMLHTGTERYCSKGHEFTPENTGRGLSRGRPFRLCLTCRRARAKAYRLRNLNAQIKKG